ncbi:MAG: type II secretion system F family protein [Planctomycetales bacterium]|nr:type II secretion system F family protein [Planctomycetales bacterium]
MFSARLNSRPLAAFCRRVGTSLEAGLEVRKVFEREAERARWRQRPALVQIHQAVARGESVADAFRAAPAPFPPLLLEMIHVGELSGKLDQAFLRLAEHFERQVSLQRTFLAGIVWPMIQLAAALTVVGLVIWVTGLIGEMTGQQVDILGLGLVGNRGLAIYAVSLVGLALAGLLFYKAAVAGYAVMKPVQRLLMAVPVLGTSLRTLALARMAWTLSVTTDTSMDAIRAAQLALRNARNVVYSSQTEQVATVMRQGRPVSEALRKAGGYPDDFLDAIEVGEDTGQLSESMERLSRLYEERAKAALAALAIVAGFLVWGLVALFIIVLIFRFALFYIGQINNVLNDI